MMFQFTESDLAKYDDMPSHWGEVGEVTYMRTYSRPIYENGKMVSRESWKQTCKRVIEGNMNILENDPTATKEWALEAFDMMYNMAWLPPGRGLWMMGTEYQKKRGGDALVNCWYVEVRPQSYEDMEMFKGTYVYSDPNKPMPSFPFVFCQDRAMLGGGVGFSVSAENISQFDSISSEIELKFFLDPKHIDWDRIKKSKGYINGDLSVVVLDSIPDKSNYTIIKIEDSREGWCIALRELIDAHWMDSNKSILLDLSSIRGYGSEIKGFGGTASGVLPLIEGLINVNKVLNARVNNYLRPSDALDIMNLIGRLVVSGNVRRTALIALGDANDEDYVNAKNYRKVLPVLELDENGYPIWEDNGTGVVTQKRKPYKQCVEELGKEKADELLDLVWRMENHRWASNNTVYIDELFEDFHFITAGIIANGEPGICNKWLIQNYGRIIDGFHKAIDEKATGMNPCFRGDMKLLTVDGYKTFKELDGKIIQIINKDGEISESKVWCSGIKKVVEIKFSDRPSIFCTPDHRFMTDEGVECKAENLKGKRLMLFTNNGFTQISGEVVGIIDRGKEKVYDFTEPKTHWGVVEGVIAHNCGEITLWNGEPCNLAEVIPYRCRQLDYDIYRALEIATQYTYRITFAKYMWPITQKVIRENRRIGVSLTGMQDYFLDKYGHYAVKGFENGDITKPIFYEEIVSELNDWYNYVDEVNKKHSIMLGEKPSIKKTTCKPSGTIAKLPGVSSGIHWHYAPYLVQRIRFHETDPNLEVLKKCGFPIEKSYKEPNTMVVEFPVCAANAEHPNFKSSGDVSLEEQFANQYLFAYAWADNAVSATLTFKSDETDKIEKLLKAYKDKIKSTSLLPYSGHGYIQAPWEPITAEEYCRRVNEIKMPLSEAYKLMTLKESGEILEEECAGGSCPLR